jgi:hypothetical protein
VLYSVQNRFNLELNSWSPRLINCFFDNCRLIEPLEISYFVFWPRQQNLWVVSGSGRRPSV